MLTKFGVKEAAKAGIFAKTLEQKETVFAMLSLLQVPVVLKEQAEKLKTKLVAKIAKREVKLDLATEKLNRESRLLRDMRHEHENTGFLTEEWDI